MYDVVVKSSRSLSRLLMSFLYVMLRTRSRLDDRAFAAAIHEFGTMFTFVSVSLT